MNNTTLLTIILLVAIIIPIDSQISSSKMKSNMQSQTDCHEKVADTFINCSQAVFGTVGCIVQKKPSTCLSNIEETRQCIKSASEMIATCKAAAANKNKPPIILPQTIPQNINPKKESQPAIHNAPVRTPTFNENVFRHLENVRPSASEIMQSVNISKTK